MNPKHKEIAQRLAKARICVIIPTYNNEKTLTRVIDGVLAYTPDLIIVNDGATDSTPHLLKNYPALKQIHFPQNRGKGAALQAGFKAAGKAGFDYAITIDSDGQHFPDDIPVFLDALEQSDTADLLLIGSRNMSQEGVPGGSSFGNRFSNFWYWVETGIRMKDTQSGYRLYPLPKINARRYFTNRFEFEIEVIVKAAWNGVVVKNVPVKVLYDESERVTHFRPFIDFARISVLNTWLVLVALVWIKPRDFFRKFQQKGIKRFFFEDVLHSSDPPLKKALSIALGVFVGIAPVWGFQTVLAIFLAVVFRLNKVIAFAFSNISIPPMIPLIIYASLKMGQFLLGGDIVPLDQIDDGFDVAKHLMQYVVGAFALATVVAVVFGTVGYFLMRMYGRKAVA